MKSSRNVGNIWDDFYSSVDCTVFFLNFFKIKQASVSFTSVIWKNLVFISSAEDRVCFAFHIERCFFSQLFFSYFVTDPFFPLSFLVNSWFPGMLDDLFQSLFLCALLLFWLCVYHGIRVQVRDATVFSTCWGGRTCFV